MTIYTALMYSFSYLEPVCCSMSSSNCCFLTCIQVSQEAGEVVWYSHLLKNFPRFIVIHTVKGFGIVTKAEIDVFLELSRFFEDLADEHFDLWFLFLFFILFNFFVLFFNFTILYWFCHISIWIHHRYTCVPHPEPSSLLPPHTIPLGRPSALKGIELLNWFDCRKVDAKICSGKICNWKKILNGNMSDV